MSYNISDNMKSVVSDYFDYLIAEGDIWEEEDDDAEEGESYWKLFDNLKKIHDLLSEQRRDEKKIYHVKRFLSIHLLYDNGVLKDEFDFFQEWYYCMFQKDCMFQKELSFSLTINWMLGYIDSGVWIVEDSYTRAA